MIDTIVRYIRSLSEAKAPRMRLLSLNYEYPPVGGGGVVAAALNESPSSKSDLFSSLRLIRPLVAEYLQCSQHQNLEVEHRRPMSQILEIEIHPRLHIFELCSFTTTAIHLR